METTLTLDQIAVDTLRGFLGELLDDNSPVDERVRETLYSIYIQLAK